MLNLVLTVIAIALVVVLGGVAFFYGGDAMIDGAIETEAAQYVNEASQIAGAVRLYRVQGNEIVDGFTLQTLVDQNYLNKIPDGWEAGSDIIVRPITEEEGAEGAAELICFTANNQAGFRFEGTEDGVNPFSADTSFGIPHCDKPDLATLVPCCVDTSPE